MSELVLLLLALAFSRKDAPRPGEPIVKGASGRDWVVRKAREVITKTQRLDVFAVLTPALESVIEFLQLPNRQRFLDSKTTGVDPALVRDALADFNVQS